MPVIFVANQSTIVDWWNSRQSTVVDWL